MDGPCPSIPTPGWNGYSTAKWDGDTLVVQTAGFRDDLWIDTSGSPMSDAAKMTERIRRPNYGTLEIEITVDDPKVYTRPWTVSDDPGHRARYGIDRRVLPRERKVVEANAGGAAAELIAVPIVARRCTA